MSNVKELTHILEDRLEDFAFLSKSSSLYCALNVRAAALLEDTADFFTNTKKQGQSFKINIEEYDRKVVSLYLN